MRNGIATLALAAAIASTSAFAIEYADFDIINQTVTPEPGYTHAVYYGSFNLLTSGVENNSADMSGYTGENGGNGSFADIGGFELGSNIEDAKVAFWFSDPQGSSEDWAMRVQVITLTREFFHTIQEGTDLGQEYYYEIFESPTYDIDILFNISATGILNYKIQVDNGSYRVDAGMLTVNATAGTAGVPDGGSTAILLGLGMIGMVGLQRKMRK